MKVFYKNQKAETTLVIVNALASASVAATFVMLFGFETPLLPAVLLHAVQLAALAVFVAEKIIRLANTTTRWALLKSNWFEWPLLLGLAAVLVFAHTFFPHTDPARVRLTAVGIYLVIEVVIKICKGATAFAASGRSPARGLISSFLILIIIGTGLLMLPESSTGKPVAFVNALFTATSATCVTGLIVKDTGADFSTMGQLVIVTLIQLGGLGIVVFGAVIALLFGRALSLKESANMQDLLSAQTVSQIGKMVAFIFIGTLLIEAIGAVAAFNMWDNVPGRADTHAEQWFCTIFHSISAFCNAGFCLFSDSLIEYRTHWAVYAVVCPLIILGGLGFGVLYNVLDVAVNRTRRLLKRIFSPETAFSMQTPRRLLLQTKIVLTVSGLLILIGMAGYIFFAHYTAEPSNTDGAGAGIGAAFFQSVTARTAGFNTVDIGALPGAVRFALILLMFIGGSPGSTAGGIKTVTFAVVLMAALATLRKRSEVEMFRRSVRMAVVGRAITLTLLFAFVLFGVTLALTVTENENGFTLGQIFFETASALGTVGLTTGITPALTSAGKLLIIVTMLVGRLGPLTLVALLTFNIRPARYSYPEEAIVVG